MSTLEGKAAPDFELYDDEKNTFKLSDINSDKNVLMLFFPGAFTSVCTTELNSVNNELDEYGVIRLLWVFRLILRSH